MMNTEWEYQSGYLRATGEEMWKLLESAADLLDRRGWCQGTYEDDDGHFCLVGALGKAAALAGYHNDKFDWWAAEVRHALCLIEDNLRASAVDWNDAPGRTAQEVVDLLRYFAKDVRRHHGG